jgi:ATPase subunit of ABC transporter with duplicated ATPase domains
MESLKGNAGRCAQGWMRSSVDALKGFDSTMIFVSHDRMFLRGLGSRVLELGGESGTDSNPVVY